MFISMRLQLFSLLLFLAWNDLFSQAAFDFSKDFDRNAWKVPDDISLQPSGGFLRIECKSPVISGSLEYTLVHSFDISLSQAITIEIFSSDPVRLRLDAEDAIGVRTGDIPVARDIVFPDMTLYLFDFKDRLFRYKPDYAKLDASRIVKLIFTIDSGPEGFKGYINLGKIILGKPGTPETVKQADVYSQAEFDQLVADIYAAGGDKVKITELLNKAELFIEKSPNLRTYANYYMVGAIYQSLLTDEASAKKFREAGEKLIYGGATTDLTTKWNDYYIKLFQTDDEKYVDMVYDFIEKNRELQNLNNYSAVGYGYERSGNYDKAGKVYDKALKHEDSPTLGQYKNYYFVFNYYSKTGDFNKAEKFIQSVMNLAKTADPNYATSYYLTALANQFSLYQTMGDYNRYIEGYSRYQRVYDNLYGSLDSCHTSNWTKSIVFASAWEKLRMLDQANSWWRRCDSGNLAYVTCYNEKYSSMPGYNLKQYPQELYPVYLSKVGKLKASPKSVSETIRLNNEYYDHLAYKDMFTDYSRGNMLGFLHSPDYHRYYDKFIENYSKNRSFSYGTEPVAEYAYFNSRDRDLEQSIKVYKQLFHLSEEWINDLVFTFGESSFITFYNSKIRDGYENFHSCVKLAKELKSPLFNDAISLAYNNILFTKSLAFRGTSKRKKAFLMSSDQEVIRMYNQWMTKKRQLVEAYQKQGDKKGGVIPGEKKDTVDIEKLREEVNNLENQLASGSKQFQTFLKLDKPDWHKIKEKLKPGEAAIEMVRFRWRDQVYYSDTSLYAAYIIRKDREFPEVMYLPDQAGVLDKKYYNLYINSIKYKLPDTASYNHFWKPVEIYLKGINKIYFSPDGIYHLININTLKNPASNQYLQQEHQIQYLTTTTELTSDYINTKPIQTCFLVGHPAYKFSGQPPQLLAQSEDATRSFVRDFRSGNINDLPGTETEILSIEKIAEAKGVKVTIFKGQDATEDKMSKVNNTDILHLATHGYWSETPPNSSDGYKLFQAMINSGLLLAGVVDYYSGDNSNSDYDGILTAYEAQNLWLDSTQLVILSACETGLGEVDAGEGVYGLQRAFRAAGARSVMTSLWKVDDEATRDFMIFFYQNYLETRDKLSAYSQAIESLRKKYPDPFYWGAFVLTGM
jgi:CHAT domain-containing protein